eukprot:scaffold6562_cov163-Amphora_coffeaeformis.AAC.21
MDIKSRNAQWTRWTRVPGGLGRLGSWIRFFVRFSWLGFIRQRMRSGQRDPGVLTHYSRSFDLCAGFKYRRCILSSSYDKQPNSVFRRRQSFFRRRIPNFWINGQCARNSKSSFKMILRSLGESLDRMERQSRFPRSIQVKIRSDRSLFDQHLRSTSLVSLHFISEIIRNTPVGVFLGLGCRVGAL